ncbi:hypothetical protein P389DRAFT_192704 [Cystobasidium minutum MCA 4210]|uniref:uncharacterized protein n=1 Tax=Cystobasidium minutum MCA 4210 TaxID=1397322 RepID=UPI0034CD8557|eukprot:jgi/Rhomi1/192704/gm1.918_g
MKLIKTLHSVLVSYLLLSNTTLAIPQQLQRRAEEFQNAAAVSGRAVRADGDAVRAESDQDDFARRSMFPSSTLPVSVFGETGTSTKRRAALRAVATASDATDSPTVRKTTSSTMSTRRKSASESSRTSKRSSSTAAKSGAAAAATTSATVKVDTSKINMTLANMPYEQSMCANKTEVQSGSVLNASWFSRGKYTNTVYVRYGIDGYQAWNLPPGGTLSPFAGSKVKGKNDVQEPDATYRMTFQTQVFAYQKGIKLSIVLFDNQKNKSVVSYESREIVVKSQCVLAKDATKDKEKEAADDEETEAVSKGDDVAASSAHKASHALAKPPPAAPTTSRAGRAVSVHVARLGSSILASLCIVLVSTHAP